MRKGNSVVNKIKQNGVKYTIHQGSPHILKTGRLPKIDPNFNISFPTTACSPTFHKTNVLHNNLKKDAINEFGIKYWTSNPVWVKFHVNIEEKVWLLVKKIQTWKDWPKLRFLIEIGWFYWNQGEEVAHFAWFGEPCTYDAMFR